MNKQNAFNETLFSLEKEIMSHAIIQMKLKDITGFPDGSE